MSNVLAFVVVGLLAPALSHCKRSTASESSEKSGAAESAPPPAAEARLIYARRCGVCHGVHGRGDGPGSGVFQPRPRDFSDKSWQSTVDDARLERVIVQGGSAARLSASMPSNPDLAAKPAVLTELIKIVRAFAK